MPDNPRAARQRPTTRKGRPTLTRELIAERALELAGAEGFPAVTMRRLAADLGVTVRALYNYVDDRQEVVELATQLLMSYWQLPELSVDRWEDSVREYSAQMRALYRRFPRALLVSLDENIRPRGVHPARLRNPDAFLGLLRGIGLTPTDAFHAHAELGVKLFGFALLIDYRDPGTTSPVPPDWLVAHPDLHVPHIAEALRTAKPTSDELFDHLVDTLIVSIRACLPDP